MIFAEKIITLRKRNGWSQEDLAARVNVSRQAVAKWEASQSIPSLDKIVQLSLIFGVTTDYLLKEEEEEISLTQDSPESSIRHVTLQEAGSYLETRRSAAWVCAIATALCILSPVTVIALGAFSEYGHIHISENTAGAIGLIVLLLMVGIAVGLFIWNDQVRNKPWEFLEHDPFVLDYGVRGLVKEQQTAFAPAKLALTIIGVILLILGDFRGHLHGQGSVYGAVCVRDADSGGSGSLPAHSGGYPVGGGGPAAAGRGLYTG